MIIRELVGGIYFGEKETGVNDQGLRFAREVLEYDENLIRRTVKVAFDTAMKRSKKLHNIHKSNVLKSSILWTDIIMETAPNYPEVEVQHMLVDAAATALCLNPGQFDVMVMENMFGDILSDQAGGILGSLGLMPSACLGPDKAYYEPSHGSAPDIAGKNIANPYPMIGSFAMMLDMSFNMREEANNLWAAMESVFAAGFSNGGRFVFTLMDTHAGVFAGYAAVGAVLSRNAMHRDPAQLRPSPVMYLFGEYEPRDYQEAWEGTVLGLARRNRARGDAQTWGEDYKTFAHGSGGAPLVYGVYRAGHVWPAAGSAQIVRFFQSLRVR